MVSSQNQALEEIKLLRRKVERRETLIEEQLLPVSKTSSDEINAIGNYMRGKKAGCLEFEKLENLKRP